MVYSCPISGVPSQIFSLSSPTLLPPFCSGRPRIKPAKACLFVQHERSYDRFNKRSDQIVRITFHGKMNGGGAGQFPFFILIFSVRWPAGRMPNRRAGVFMLLIACINFINLSTAGAGKRAREVGIRKVMGSLCGPLIGQFLTESLLLTLAGTLISIGLVYAALPLFNSITGQELSLRWSANSWLIPALLGIIIATGLLAGLYPAFFLSAFNPVTVLKGLVTPGSSAPRGLAGDEPLAPGFRLPDHGQLVDLWPYRVAGRRHHLPDHRLASAAGGDEQSG